MILAELSRAEETMRNDLSLEVTEAKEMVITKTEVNETEAVKEVSKIGILKTEVTVAEVMKETSRAETLKEKTIGITEPTEIKNSQPITMS